MKLGLFKITNIYNIFASLTKKKYSNWGTALKLANAAKELKANRDFYLEKERELLDSYVLKDKEGNFQITDKGQPKFKNVDDAVKFNDELIALQKTEADIFDPITVSIDDFKSGEDTLTPEEIMLLSDVITFTHEEVKETGGVA